MARAKQARWYEVDGATAYVYDAPWPHQSQSISIIHVADLAYYRTNFDLRKIWA